MDRSSLIFKVLAGKASKQEEWALEQWIDASLDNRREFEDIRWLWLSKTGDTPARALDFYEGFTKIKEKVGFRKDKRIRIASRVWTATLILTVLVNIYLVITQSTRAENQTLEFKDTPVQIVMIKLQQVYGITIETEQETVRSCAFTATFSNAEVEDVLHALTVSLNLEYQRLQGKNYRLNGRGC